MASKYPWYSRAADLTHRVTVLALVGATLYMSGAVVYTLWSNGRENKQRLEVERTRRAAIAEQQRISEAPSQSNE
ncbi:DEKNAAC103600 [Brettanomyces naardenensis]|uniref:DEKNAAC103600 n=1 Tax=Brettanomyces naardenensis TaxID=13370 RepID=A0A448YN72_BRENA|nr:DEKNAAC103600 [Brettanomyces naardenensis]